MGTNYYAIPKATDELKEKIIQLVKNNQLLEARKIIPVPVHIGKSSLGWQFCFNHNAWEFFDKTLDSLDNFLKNSILEDEYGRMITYDEFWKMVNNKKHLLDNKEYYTNWERYNKEFFSGKPLSRPTYIPPNFGQETHFGLFFSDCTEFS